MSYYINDSIYGKDWIAGNKMPESGLEVYAIIEQDTDDPAEPELIEATVRFEKGNNFEYLWNIKLEDGNIYSSLIAGSWSVIC